MLKNIKQQLKLLGRIRKGDPKTDKAPGRNTKHFRLDASVAGSALQPVVEERFKAKYGDRPTRLECVLVGDKTSDCFHAFYEEWVASSMVRRCDGESQVMWLTPDKKSYCDTPKPCDQSKCKCKPQGKLRVMLPELGLCGYFEVMTTSFNDVQAIQSQLMEYEQFFPSFKGLPILVSRSDREISKPRGGKRTRSVESLIEIDLPPQVQQKLLGQWKETTKKVLSSVVTDQPLSLPISPVVPAYETVDPVLLPTVTTDDVEKKKLALISYTRDLLDVDQTTAEVIIKEGKKQDSVTNVGTLKAWLQDEGKDYLADHKGEIQALVTELEQTLLREPAF